MLIINYTSVRVHIIFCVLSLMTQEHEVTLNIDCINFSNAEQQSDNKLFCLIPKRGFSRVLLY